jgi:hypothetical protein
MANVLQLFNWKLGMKTVWNSVRRYCTPFKVLPEALSAQSLSAAAKAGCHAAVWGNFQGEKIADGVYRIGQRQLLGLFFNKPEDALPLSESNCDKIAEYLRSKHFVWSGDLHVIYENVHSNHIYKGTDCIEKYDLGPYYLRK